MNRELKVKTKAGTALETSELQRVFRNRRVKSSTSDDNAQNNERKSPIEDELSLRLKGLVI